MTQRQGKVQRSTDGERRKYTKIISMSSCSMVLSRHNDTKTGQSTKKYSRRKTKIHQHYLDVILQYGFEPTPPPTPEEEESEEEQDEDEDGFAGGGWMIFCSLHLLYEKE